MTGLNNIWPLLLKMRVWVLGKRFLVDEQQTDFVLFFFELLNQFKQLLKVLISSSLCLGEVQTLYGGSFHHGGRILKFGEPLERERRARHFCPERPAPSSKIHPQKINTSDFICVQGEA